jgi:uncharacterized membrane protein
MATLNGIARGTAVSVGVVVYQVGAHYAASTPGAHGFGLALVLVPLLLVAAGTALRSPHRVWLLPAWALGCMGLWLIRAPLLRHFGWGLYLENLSFYLALATVFGRTLKPGREPLCTRLAAMVHGPLAAPVARYTRRVTLAWTMFFVGIVCVSTALFATTSMVVWSTFANYLSLPLVALMFAAEYACRRFALPDMRRSSPLDAMRAYWRSTQIRERRTR